jgi:IS5 family transposase
LATATPRRLRGAAAGFDFRIQSARGEAWAEVRSVAGATTTGREVRKRVEEIFGWMKTVGGFRRTRYRGEARTQLASYLVGAAYNLLRIARLLPAAA